MRPGPSSCQKRPGIHDSAASAGARRRHWVGCSASKKSGKSIKENRAIKKSKKAVAETDPMAVFLRGEPRPSRI